MSWRKLFQKVISGIITGATAGAGSVAVNPNIDINSAEGITQTAVVSIIVSSLTALSNYWKNK